MATVVVGRLDNNKRIDCADGASIASAFMAAGYTKGPNEVIQDIEGVEFPETDTIESGKGYFFCQRVKSGQ